jgi:micrococcal nuclease
MLLILLSLIVSVEVGDTFLGTVVAVTDADAFELRVAGKPLLLKLYGADAPEIGQPYRKESLSAFKSYIVDRDVVATVRDNKSDSRPLVDVIVDGDSIAQKMVEQGFAWHAPHHPDTDSIKGFEEHARANHLGLWKQPLPQAPWEYRASLKKANPSDRQLTITKKRRAKPKEPVQSPTPAAADASPQLPQPPSKPNPVPETDTLFVHITNTGAKYHSAGCRWLKSDIVVSLEQARERGLTPCQTCGGRPFTRPAP